MAQREHAIGPVTQIPQGEGREFLVDGVEVAVFHTRDGQVFATQARCPHKGGPLADGLTDGRTVMCPLHDRIYDFGSGAGIGTDCSVEVYPVRVDAAGVLMLVPEAARVMEPAE